MATAAISMFKEKRPRYLEQAVKFGKPTAAATSGRRRTLGTLEGKMSAYFANDFAITDEELADA